MADAPKKQRMIKVKKADGTVVRVSLDEFKKMKGGKAPVQKKPAQQPKAKPKSTEKRVTNVSSSETKKPKQSKPSSNTDLEEAKKLMEQAKAQKEAAGKKKQAKKEQSKSVPESEKEDTFIAADENTNYDPFSEAESEWDEEDHKSLLHDDFHQEDLHEVTQERRKALAKTSPVKDIFVDQAIASSKTVPKNPKKTRPEGAPPRPPLVKAIPASMGGAPQKNRAKAPAPTKAPAPEPKPKISPKNLPEKKAAPGLDKKVANPGNLGPHRQVAKPSASLQPRKPVLEDVVSKPRSSAVGPVGELENFTLVDMRRLAPTSAEIEGKMKQKFANLMQDSYVLYMEGVTAWHKSPIYMEYQNALIKSLSEKRKVEEVLSAGESLTYDEFKALASLHKKM